MSPGQLGWLQQGYHERETQTGGISGCTVYVKGKLLNCVSAILEQVVPAQCFLSS